MMTAKEFRTTWEKQNPNVIHIPSVYELGLMQAYAEYYHQGKIQNIERAKVDSGVAALDGDYTTVTSRTANGETNETPVDGALPPKPDDGNKCPVCNGYGEIPSATAHAGDDTCLFCWGKGYL